MRSTLNKTSFINSFSINFRDVPFLEIRKQFITFNIVIFFIYNIRKTTSPGVDRRVGSLQPIHTILGLTLDYHVFLNIIAFRNTYPSQPYTSHALHALSWLKRALLFGSGNSLSDTGGTNDGKKGTQQRSIKVSSRHRQRDREHNNTITGQKRVALIPKWFTKVKNVVFHDYHFTIIAMIDSGADMNYIQEGLIPSKYFEKSTERLVSANGSQMKIKYERLVFTNNYVEYKMV